MEPTIRSYLKRRVRAVCAVAISGWLLFAASGALAGHRKQPPGPLIFLGFALFAGAILAFQWWIKCPKCSRKLAQSIGMLVAFRGKSAPNYCPYCGVHLDEPMPKPGESNQGSQITLDQLIGK
jgi:hypothetical protein